MTFNALHNRLPWRAAVPAWLMVAEGAVVASVGQWLVNNPAGATVVLMLTLGAVLLVNGTLRLVRFLRAAQAGRDRWDAALGAPGAVAGIIAILIGLLVSMPVETAALWFGVALVASGALEGFERIVRRPAARALWLFVLPAVQIGAGLALVVLAMSDNIDAAAIGQIVAVFGVALLALGLVRLAALRQGRGLLTEHEPEDPAVVASRSVRE